MGLVHNLDNIFKSRDITLPTKVRLVKAMVFPVVMCVLRVGPPKNLYFQTVVLEKTLEIPSHFKIDQIVNPKGNQS